LLERPNVKARAISSQASRMCLLVGWTVQRLMGEDTQTNKPDTSAAPERDDIVRAI